MDIYFEDYGDEILEWLYNHKQEWNDCCNYFGVNPEDKTSLDDIDIEEWLYNNDQVLEDLYEYLSMYKINKQVDMYNINESIQPISVKEALTEAFNLETKSLISNFLNEAINESLENTLIKDKLKVNSNYETEDGFKFKYIGTQLIDEVLFYKFKPLSKKAKEITSEIAEDEDLPNDGFAYMTGETVFYTFFD